MDLSSRAYHKALFILAKQQPVATTSRLDTEVLIAQLNLGTFFFSLKHFLFNFHFTEHAHVISDADHDAIQRTRDILSNAVIADLIVEDPKSLESFHSATRHQIIVICQSLRLYLVLIDHLMDIVNQSSASAKGKGVA